MDSTRTSPRWRSLRSDRSLRRDRSPRRDHGSGPASGREPRPGLARAAVVGAALGGLWGAGARVWMRLVSTTPEFSWAGSLAIVALAAVLGAGVGVSSAARSRTGWRRAARLAVLPGLVIFAGQGMPFLPAFVVGGLLLRRRHLVARVATVVVVAAPAVLLWWSERLDEYTMLSAPLRVQVSMLVGFPLLATLLAIAGHLVWGCRATFTRQSPSPDRARSNLLSDSSLDAPAGPA